MPEEISPYVFIYLKSFFLGIIQGFTEFLPISSTAHLKVVPYFLGWNDLGASFSASIQLGSAVAIIFYFRNQISSIIDSFFSIFNHRKVLKDDKTRLATYIFIASIPICIFGFLIKIYWHNYSYSNFRGLFSIAIVLFVVSFITLGYLGTVTVTETGKVMSVICTLMYFAFFLLMPIYTSIEKTYEVPDRL